MSSELRDRLQTTLSGTYAIERELGGGGMSRVFVAEEKALGRRVVVKVLPPEMAAGVNVDRFRREIQLAASLQHPHIVPLHAAGSSGDLLYFTMPLIDGESLRARIARDGELPIHAAVRILRDVVDALAYAHSRGVVHRDIKPDNVLLSGQHALVTDFGVAKALESSTGEASLTSLGVALGTPAYMAPEQASADPHIDHRADIYAFGCLAYEVLTGRAPFAGMNAQQVLAVHITQRPDPVTTRRNACPQALGVLVTRCLEKQPADRPQSATELHEQLELIATPSGGMPPTTAVRAVEAPRPSRRRWLPIAAGLTGLAVVLGAGYWGLGRRTSLDRYRVRPPMFVNKTGDPALDPVIANVTSAVSGGLAEIEGVEVVEGEGASATAGTSVAGALYRLGDSIQLSATVTDVSSGKTVYSVGPVEALTARPREAIEPLTQRIVGGVAIMLDPTWGVQGVLPSRPPRWDAYREFHQGDLSFYSEIEDSAFAHFARAATLDATFSLARLRGTQVLVNAGSRRWARADSAVIAAFAERATLSPFERAYLDWFRAWHRGDWEGAHTASVLLTEAAPRSEVAAYIRGNFANISMRWHEAARVLTHLDPASTTLRIRSAYYANLANAHHMLGQHKRELEVAQQARQRFPDQMRVRQLEVRALAALGDSAELGRRLSDALALPTQSEGMGTAGRVLLTAANEARAHGHPALAKLAVSQLLEWVGTGPTADDSSSAARELRIDALRLSGELNQARALTDSLVLLYPDDPTFLGVQGVLAAQQGRRADASRAAAQLSRIRRPDLFGEPLVWRARIGAQLGDKAQAVGLVRQATAEGARILASSDADPDLEPLRDYPPFRELSRARD
jgi:serine/threonine-protein kinase